MARARRLRKRTLTARLYASERRWYASAAASNFPAEFVLSLSLAKGETTRKTLLLVDWENEAIERTQSFVALSTNQKVRRCFHSLAKHVLKGPHLSYRQVFASNAQEMKPGCSQRDPNSGFSLPPVGYKLRTCAIILARSFA